MKADPIDQPARRRFAEELDTNFAVSANAGSGKTTAISHRLAAMAQRPDARELLARTAVVTYTKKAARQIGQRARSVLLSRLAGQGAKDLSPLDSLERAFFGTIHSFCVQLAQRYGHRLGVHLNPEVLDEQSDEAVWMDFLSQDSMDFRSVTAEQWALFSRLQPLDGLFPLARSLERPRAEKLRQRMPGPPPRDLPQDVLHALLQAKPARAQKKTIENWNASVEQVKAWRAEFLAGGTYLHFPKPEGSAAAIKEFYQQLFAPLKQWVAEVGGVIAAELSDRFRTYRLERGLQTYADQVDLALRALGDSEVLERIRRDGWRIILDEAQDTDPQQFSVLVEIARPAGATPGSWPSGGGVPPRPGHFSLVGDGQQSIYSSRADLRNFMRHVDAFARADGGERLEFSVSFRAPTALIQFLNTGMPDAFSPHHRHNLGLPPAEGAEPPVLQVPYQALSPRPDPESGRVDRLPLESPALAPESVGEWLAEECRQVAGLLARVGPAGVGASKWGEVCVLAPRNEWLKAARDALQTAGIKVALQQRRSRSAENPVFAWWSGVLAIVLDPAHAFEWFGVLRELFALPDDVLAEELRRLGAYRWEEPSDHAPVLEGPLEGLRPFLLSAEDEGTLLGVWAAHLAEATGMRELACELDRSGGLEEELDRLLAEATQFGLDGLGPRDWFEHLLRTAEQGRPVGRAEDDAINLLTIHSAKGLEWPVVITLGLWRGIGRLRETGLQCIEDPVAGLRIYLGASEIPGDVADSREREHFRELVRLKYVALTRPQRRLILPWGEGFGSAPRRDERSFAQLWGNTALWLQLPLLEGRPPSGSAVPIDPTAQAARAEEQPLAPVTGDLSAEVPPVFVGSPLAPMPLRLLPHQLAVHPDPARHALDESPVERLRPEAVADDAAAYGVWWHETLEFWPWQSGPVAEETHCDAALVRADAAGWGSRAREELALFRRSEARRLIEDAKWTRQAELPLFAPLTEGAWIDGVIDLLLRDRSNGKHWVVDWKTNRRRREESDETFCDRLVAEYRPQLEAYRGGLAQLLEGDGFTLWIYPTALGRLVPIN
ncbi:MAG: UvrD-helicase domain-containing protein [Opitutaceae bacterium]|nr:UvrD-helicase domain-containing protein [Opitutaceae bacterium]